MKKFFLSLLALCCVSALCIAAVNLNVKSVGSALMSGSNVEFSLEAYSANNKLISSFAGSAKILDNKYCIKLNDGLSVVSNGKDIYIYNPDTNEAIIMNAGQDNGKDKIINPFVLVTAPPDYLVYSFSGFAKSAQQNTQVPFEIVIRGFKDEPYSRLVIKLSSYNKLTDKSAGQFVFNPALYPDIEITDLR